MDKSDIKAAVTEALHEIQADAETAAASVETAVKAKFEWPNWAKRLAGMLMAFLAPIASLFTARTAWLIVGFYIIARVIGKGDAEKGLEGLRLYGLSVLWAVVGIVIAVHARKWLIPDIKLSEWYSNILGARDLPEAIRAVACAIVVFGVFVIQLGCMLLIALGALHSHV